MSEPSASATHRATAIRYWERKRRWYNAALVPPTLLGYLPVDMFRVMFGDPAQIGYLGVAVMLLVAAVAANVCFCLVYALEFLWGSTDPASVWMQSRRRRVFILGTLFAMLLALLGARSIALAQVTGIRL